MPRVHRLIDAYADRHARDMREWGKVVATAMSQPKDLEKIQPPKKQQRDMDDSAWETKRWW